MPSSHGRLLGEGTSWLEPGLIEPNLGGALGVWPAWSWLARLMSGCMSEHVEHWHCLPCGHTTMKSSLFWYFSFPISERRGSCPPGFPKLLREECIWKDMQLQILSCVVSLLHGRSTNCCEMCGNWPRALNLEWHPSLAWTGPLPEPTLSP